MGCIACCGCEASNDKPVTKLKKYSDRGCTDILILLLFVCGWIAGFAVFGAAYPNAEPAKLVKGLDYQGCICGMDNSNDDGCKAANKDKTSSPYAAWPSPLTMDFKVCLSTCDQTATDNRFPLNYDSLRFVYYCLPNPLNATAGDESEASKDFSSDSFSSPSQLAARAFGDLQITWPVILVAAGFAAIFSFLYAFILRKIARCVVWTTLVFVMIAGFLVAYAFLQYGDETADSDLSPERAQAMRAMGWVCVAVTFLFIVAVVFLRKRIEIAIEVVRETCSAIVDMPSLVFFPFFPFVLVCVYFVYWIFIALYVFSVTKEVTYDFPSELDILPAWGGHAATYRTYEWDDSFQGLIAYHFFHLLWNLNFLIYFAYFCIAGAVAAWYFTPYTEGKKQVSEEEGQLTDTVIRDSVKRTARFHIGTVAFGALIIAIIQFLRAMVTYLEAQAKKTSYDRLKKIIFCCVNTCLYCLECCMDKINKNGYIWSAIFGDNFAVSCCSGFGLVYRNLARVAAMSMIGEYLVILGKVCIALVPTGIAGMILTQSDLYKDTLNSIVMPLLVVFLLSYVIGAIFMTVFETASDTIFICFLIDSENNPPENMFASKELITLVDDHAAQSKEMAEEMKRDSHDESVGMTKQSASNNYGDASAPTE